MTVEELPPDKFDKSDDKNSESKTDKEAEETPQISNKPDSAEYENRSESSVVVHSDNDNNLIEESHDNT